ncbi:polymorphic toxin-type HINT domain-containing protein [Actinosynnema sp. CA-248983]
MTASLAAGLTSDVVRNTQLPLLAPEELPPRVELALPKPADPLPEPARMELRDATWPTAGKSPVTAGGSPQRAGDLPVTVAVEGDQAKQVDVEVAGQDLARKAGVTGVVIAVKPAETTDGRMSVGVDYSGFRNAVGGEYGSRLKLERLPECALTTPEAPQCQVRTPLPTTNDTSAKTVTTRVAAEPMVFAATADGAGENGTFKASSLSPSGTWSVSGSGGSFSWQYPISVPPAAAGGTVAPSVSLSYSSSTVDGRTMATNNQAGWIGQGWNYSPGSIERSYRACAEDKTLPQAQQTGDQCWAGQVVSLNLGGQATELVYDEATNTWREANDRGSRVELLTGAVNGVNNGEYWKVTNTSGVSYYFGRNRGPGYTNQEETNSAWTVPVYGPRAGDKCHNPSGFAASWCMQAWRWNLDFVEDTHGNVTSYYYARETNHYGANNQTTGVAYTRAGLLKRIDYGLRNVNGSIYGATVPNQIVFDLAERCQPSAEFDCDPAKFTAANAKHWPDVPQDQECKAGAVCNHHSPSYWSTKRLTAITTQYNPGSGPVKVDEYRLAHHFPNPLDTVKELLLASITRTGFKGGSSLALPPVAFAYGELDNRVEGYFRNSRMAHRRLTEVRTDTGSSIRPTYSTKDCTKDDVPSDLANNTRRCYPVYWTQPFKQDPDLDFFHKYVVEKVEVQDLSAVSPTQVTTYTYLGSPAWHYDDFELVRPEHRTYGQYRGYAKVEKRTGTVADRQTLTRTTYYRGMDGDTLPGNGRRTATITNSLGEVVTDHAKFADTAHEEEVFNGDGGARLSTKITELGVIGTTATRARTGLPALTADVVAPTRSRAVTHLAGGGTRTATTTNRYDSTGRLTNRTDSGDGVPDLCTRTSYADNTTTWVRDRVAETTTSQQVCPVDGVTQTSILNSTRTFYDNHTTLGQITAGDSSRTDAATANTNDQLTFATTATATYDAAGRVLTKTDALNRTTSTAYTPTEGGLLTKTVTTNPKNQTSTVELDPARGSPTASIDVGARRTDAEYDALGRLIAVWKPGQNKSASHPASVTYSYLVRTDGPLAVTTKTFIEYGAGLTNNLTSIDLFDAFGQLRQTQTDAVGGGTVGKTVFYDSHGRTRHTHNRWKVDGAPATTLVGRNDSQVNDRTVTDYDGAGRPVLVTAYNTTTATWKTRTVHGGDRTTVFPPHGGVTRTVITDVRGQKTESRDYTAPPTINGDTVTGGTFQTTTHEYTPLGQLKKATDPVGNNWTFTYDFLGRKTSQTDPDAGTTSTTYDLAGQILTTTDGRGQTLAFTYDALGRKTAEHADSTSGTKLAEWRYDTATNGVGLPSYSTRYTPTGAYDSGPYAYNGSGLVAKTLVRVPATETGLNATYTTMYGYTVTGLLASLNYPSGGGLVSEAVGINYNQYGKPTKSSSANNAYVSDAVYTHFGEARQFTLGPEHDSARLTYDYDAQTRRPTQTTLAAQTADGQIDDTRYTYDAIGNVTKTVNTQGRVGQAPVRTQCYKYDALRRLSDAWTATDDCAATPTTTPGQANIGGPTPYWTSWTFEPGGLRTTQTQHALPGATGGDTTTTYTYPTTGTTRPHSLTSATTTGPSGSTLSTYGYDQSGNTTRRTLASGEQTLTWDKENRLDTVTSPEGTTKYVYDADGNQLIRRDPGKTTLFLPGQELTRDTTTGAVTGTRYYTHNGTTVAMRVAGTNPVYLVSDLHGTNSVAVQSVGFAVSRRTFDPYGNQLNAVEGLPWPDRHGFLNKPVSEATGLTDIGARKYDSVTGRFISVDPILDLENSQQWTGYAYADNNPTTFSDPTGLIKNCGPDGDGCGARNYDDVGADPHNPANPDNWGTKNWGGGLTTTYDASTGDFYIGYYSLGKYGAEYGNALRRGVIELLQGERSNSRALYGELDEQTLLSLAEIACHRIKNCERDGVWKEVIAANYGVMGGFAEGALGTLGAINSYKALRPNQPGRPKHMCANSFTGDTHVLMADGTTKPIEDIKVGDRVANSEPGWERTEQHDVLAVIVTDSDKEYVDVAVAGPHGVETISATAHHPFYNATTDTWVDAAGLNVGDELDMPGSDRAVVHAVRHYTATLRTYNLTIGTVHTYFVVAGNTPVLVHNQGGAASPNKGDAGTNRLMHELRSQGYVIRGTEISAIAANGVKVRFDVVAERDGKLHLFDAKNGPGSVFTTNQGTRGGYASIEAAGGTWYGGNAAKADLHGSFDPSEVKIAGYGGHKYDGKCKR